LNLDLGTEGIAMTEKDSIKVYELAKELGIDSISLLDRLKEIDIKVKNHMSALSSEEADSARTALQPKAKKKKKAATKTKKKTVSKKKTAAATAAAPAATKTKKKAVVRRKAADADAPAAAAAAVDAEAPAAPKAAPTIIRRRTRSTNADGDVQETVTRKVITRRESEDGESPDQVEVVTSSETKDATPAPAPVQAAETAAAPTEGAEEAASDKEKVVLPASAKATLAAPSPNKKPKISILSTAKLETKSKLNVIEIQKPEPQQSRGGAPGTQGPPGTRTRPGMGRITRLTKESIDKMAEEEAAKKKRGGGGERPTRPEDVRFADYRKKEVSFIGRKKKALPTRELRQTQITKMKASKRVIQIQEVITVGELANQMSVKATEVIKKLIGMGQMATVNQALDLDTAQLVSADFGFEVKDVGFKEDSIIEKVEDKEEDLKPRPPVVTVMGHVDHGKTSLLDAIKSTNVVSKEAGGITQHIGAYTVEADGKQITFIDTPGHAAFTSMRARGANATDIVILVCAADDGVMPQTREAVQHAKAAGAPIVVAVNKIDKPGANPEKVMQGLSELELLPEDWGGDTMFIPVSAIERTNLDKLLEAVLLNAEILELKSNPTALPEGVVLEARLEKGRGPVATVLVQRGTLRKGEALVSGMHAGRVRAMMDHRGKMVKEVGPGMAAEITGLEGVPGAGDIFTVVKDDSAAKKLVDYRKDQERRKTSVREKVSLEQLMAKLQAGETKELRVVLKADVYGSVEAVKESLEKLSTEKCKVNVVLSAAGGITESDVLLARASEALILGFNVRPETKARQVAESEGIEVKSYTVIYELLDDVKKAMVGLLDKKKVEKFVGRAEVRETFSVPKIGTVAGTAVIDGKMVRNAQVRLLRDNVMLYEGKLSSLKRFKDDAKEVQTGYECGIGIEGYNDIKTGDIIEAFELEFVTPELDS
jgi:translation initiation factor IF-2